jgi:hypothetical protein
VVPLLETMRLVAAARMIVAPVDSADAVPLEGEDVLAADAAGAPADLTALHRSQTSGGGRSPWRSSASYPPSAQGA